MEAKKKCYNFSLMISAFSTAIATGILSILLNEVIDTFSLSGTRQGLMSSMISLGSLISLCVIVLLQKKFSKAYLIIGLGLLTVIALILQGLSQTYILFLFLCFILGFGNGGVDTCQSSFLADINPDNTSKNMGMLHGIFGIASIISPLILRNLLNIVSWRKVYFICAVVAFIFIAQFAVTTHLNRETVKKVTSNKTLSVSDSFSFFKSKYNIVLIMFIFIGAAAQSGVITWVIRYVTIVLDNKNIATMCLSAYWIFATLSRFFSPKLPFKPHQIISAGALISALAWAVAIFTHSAYVICVACGIVGISSGSCIPMCLSEGAVNNRNNTGFSTSALMIFKTAAQILSPIFISFISSIFHMGIGMIVTAVLFLIDAVLGLFLQKYKTK